MIIRIIIIFAFLFITITSIPSCIFKGKIETNLDANLQETLNYNVIDNLKSNQKKIETLKALGIINFSYQERIQTGNIAVILKIPDAVKINIYTLMGPLIWTGSIKDTLVTSYSPQEKQYYQSSIYEAKKRDEWILPVDFEDIFYFLCGTVYIPNEISNKNNITKTDNRYELNLKGIDKKENTFYTRKITLDNYNSSSNKKQWVVIKEVRYNSNGDSVLTASFEDFKEIDNIVCPAKLIVTDNTGVRMEIKYNKLKFNDVINDSQFIINTHLK